MGGKAKLAILSLEIDHPIWFMPRFEFALTLILEASAIASISRWQRVTKYRLSCLPLQ